MEAPLQPLNFASLARCYAHERSGRESGRARERLVLIHQRRRRRQSPLIEAQREEREGFREKGGRHFAEGVGARRFIGGSFRRFIGPHHPLAWIVHLAPRHPSLSTPMQSSKILLSLDIDIERIRSFARSFGGRGRRR